MFLLAARVAGSGAPSPELLPLALLALLAMGLPLNVGGWGPREGVTAWAFGAAGLGAAQGLTVAVVYGVLTFVASPAGGGRAGRPLVRGSAGAAEPRPRAADGTDDARAPAPSRRRRADPVVRIRSQAVGGGSKEKYAPKESAEAARSSFPFSADAQGRTADDAGIGIGGHAQGEQMTAVVRNEIGGLVTGPDEFGVGVQQNGGLDFPRVHIA